MSRHRLAQPATRSRPSRAPHAVVLVAFLLPTLAGCIGEGVGVDPSVVEAVADVEPMTWGAGNYWAYEATFSGNLTVDVALVVHEATADGFLLGTNVSAGFFGLPFTGNVTREHNPIVRGEEWPLFRFPLHDGKSWEYEMYGHAATTTAHAALVELPDGRQVPGYRLVSAAYGRTFAEYEFVPEAAWFTSLRLIEPTDGSVVLDVRLRDYGADFDQAYWVERTLRTVYLEYPTAPGRVEVRIPGGYDDVRAYLTARVDAGILDAEVSDDGGQRLAAVRAVGAGGADDRGSADASTPTTWRLSQAGVGRGVLRLEVTAFMPTDLAAGAREPARIDTPEVDLAALLQSTRPDLPQTGHVTSTGSPVAV